MINSDDRADKRQERREQTRAALLDAAERLWAERGIHGVSLDEIAGTAGLTKGAVYSNFTGKTDLLLALLDRHAQHDHDLDLCEELRGSRQDRLEQAGHHYTSRLEGEDARLPALLLVEFWLYGMRDFAAGWRIADWYHARRDNLTRELTDADGISATDRAAMAMAMDLGLAIQHLLDPERVPAETCASGIRLVLGPALPDDLS
ncbi:TetR/AcrR family transcriptional regulator [Actinomadura scrupuli]|uniref:TetR/AcrR family transcriptional regulator n=1 Tax=Actinomadura scrupuli TaxID=559629 RepID=UPI003D96816F